MTIDNDMTVPADLRDTFKIVAATELWVIAPFIAASIPFARVLPLILVLAAAYWAIRWFAFGHPTVRTSADLPLILLLATLPIALWMTPLPRTTYEQVMRLLSGVALYYAVANWSNSRQQVRLLVNAFHVAGIALACSALVTIRWNPSTRLAFIPQQFYDRLPVLVTDVVNQNVMAGTLVILLPLVMALPLFAMPSVRWFEWPFILVALGTMAGVLVLTQSRGGILAFAVALMSLILLRWRYGFILVIAIMIAVGVSMRTEWGVAQITALMMGNTFSDVNTRLDIWSRAWAMIQDYPLTGIGMGSFRQMLDSSYPLFQSTDSIPHSHNLVLQIAVDLGVPGVIAWFAILLFVTRDAWQVYCTGRARGDAWVAGLGAGFIASQVALVTHGMVDAVTWGMVRTAVIVWAMWGLAAASKRLIVIKTTNSAAQHAEKE